MVFKILSVVGLPAAVGVDSFGRFVAVAVVLYKRTIAFAVDKRTFVARTVGQDFDAETMLLPIAELAFVFISLSGNERAFAVHLTVLPSSVIAVAGLRFVDPAAVRFVGFPRTDVRSRTFPDISTLTALFAGEEMAGILVAGGKSRHTFAGAFTVLVLSLVDIAVTEGVNALSVLIVVFPLAFVDVAVGIVVSAKSIAKIVEPIAFIFRAIVPIEGTFTLLFVVDPLTVVESTTHKTIDSVAISLVVFPFSVVDVAVIIVHLATTLLFVLIPKPFVAVIVDVVESSFTVLLIVEPVAFIFFAVGKRISAIPLTLTFFIFTFVSIVVGIHRYPFAIRLIAEHFAGENRPILEGIGTDDDSLGIDNNKREEE